MFRLNLKGFIENKVNKMKSLSLQVLFYFILFSSQHHFYRKKMFLELFYLN